MFLLRVKLTVRGSDATRESSCKPFLSVAIKSAAINIWPPILRLGEEPLVNFVMGLFVSTNDARKIKKRCLFFELLSVLLLFINFILCIPCVFDEMPMLF
ncbi:hypothetical protein HanIR_Chr13g0654971 [Helianthus annuus]|nr:hypothetical protein HanIR_Chr13g0654971 [Helianthus annuus]